MPSSRATGWSTASTTSATHGFTRIESTAEADDAWTEHLEQVGAATLFPKADSWYMSANVPGKTRQLLNYPATDMYLELIARSAADGYEGFVLS